MIKDSSSSLVILNLAEKGEMIIQQKSVGYSD